MMNEIFIVTNRCGTEIGDPILFHTKENAKKYIQSEIYDCWMDNIQGMLEGELGESVLDDVKRVFSYCEEQGLYEPFESDGIYLAYAGGDDWLEFQITKKDLSKDFEDDDPGDSLEWLL